MLLFFASLFGMAGPNVFAQNDKIESGTFHKDFSDGDVAYNDSTGNIDSLYYPYTTKPFDASLINGRQPDTLNGNSKILYRGLYVSAGTTTDSVRCIILTNTEGGYSGMWVPADTVVLIGTTSTGTPTEGVFTFSSIPRANWKMKIDEKHSGSHNRNDGYVLFEITSSETDEVISKFRLGNY